MPQTLLGPAAFPLDSLLASLGSLLGEHDQNILKLGATNSGKGDDDYEMVKDTEMAVGRIQVSATVSFLTITTQA